MQQLRVHVPESLRVHPSFCRCSTRRRHNTARAATHCYFIAAAETPQGCTRSAIKSQALDTGTLQRHEIHTGRSNTLSTLLSRRACITSLHAVLLHTTHKQGRRMQLQAHASPSAACSPPSLPSLHTRSRSSDVLLHQTLQMNWTQPRPTPATLQPKQANTPAILTPRHTPLT